VNTLADAFNPGDNTLTLRDAIHIVTSEVVNGYSSAQQAQISGTLGSNDVINFQSGLTGTLTLGSQLPSIQSNLSIQGPGANLLTISGNGAARVFDVDFSLGNIYGSGTNFSISGLTIANGSTDVGSGLYFLDVPNSNYSLLTSNPFPNGTLTIQDCVVTGNSASQYGGGIVVVGNGGSATTVNISDTTFSNNQAGFGGAANFVNCTAIVTNCTISGNSVSSEGGGLYFQGNGTLMIQDCVFTGNSASSGGGLLNGGGLFVIGNGASATTVNVSNSTISNNQAGFVGAAGFLNCTASLTNCTVSGNTATSYYAGLQSYATGMGQTADLTLTNCTIADNHGPGASTDGLDVITQDGATSATASYLNTIFANSTSATDNVLASGPGASVTSLGYNISDDATGNLTGPDDQPNTNPLLAPLGYFYGGPILLPNSPLTPTMPLLPGSPAIGAGTSTGAPLTDQRSVSRAGSVDIGAYQTEGFIMGIVGGDQQSAPAKNAFPSPLTVLVIPAIGDGPVQGGVVTFSAPASGASVTFPTGTRATINAADEASLTVAANGTSGSYSVSAAANGALPVNFSLTNLTAISLNPTTLLDGTYGSAYSQTLTATGGAGSPYTFMLLSGALPGGLTIASNGALTGTPTAAGTFSFTVQAKDNDNFTGSQNYTLTIATATVTITPTMGQSKVYGAPVPVLTYASSGFVNGDSATLLSGLLGTTATAACSIGTYAFTLGTLSAGNNYTLVLAVNPPTFAVTPATLTITPTAGQSKIYGAAVPILTYTPSGFVNGDSSALVSGALATAATAASPVGTYGFTLGTLSASTNYILALGANPPTFAITPAPLTITPTAGQSKVYGAAVPALTYTPSGLVNNDPLSTITGALATIATTASPVGSYAFTLGTLSAGNNYTVMLAANPPTFAITPAPVTVTADNQVMAPGGTVPALTYHYTGLVNGDTSAAFRGSLATTATSSSATGSYAITQGTLAATGNYTLSTFHPGTLTVLGPGVTLVGTTLYVVGGSTSNDQVLVTPVGSSNTGSTGVQVKAVLNHAASTTTFTQAGLSLQIYGYSGNDTIVLDPRLTVTAAITAGNGNDGVAAGAATVTVTLGNGNDAVALGDGNNTVTLGNGNDGVLLGNGNNVVVTGNGNDAIGAGNGDNLVVAGLGHHAVVVGNGSNILIDGSVTLTQSGDSLRHVLNEWIQSGKNAAAIIRAELAVTDNTSHANLLLAGSGLDWFWETYSKDTTNRRPGDLLN
jgi:hypothetical protein